MDSRLPSIMRKIITGRQALDKKCGTYFTGSSLKGAGEKWAAVLSECCDCEHMTSCCLGSRAAEGDRHTARRPIHSDLLPDVLGES